ncbi:MAG: LLM class F420-dependent oxidoreductase [Thaumarchaeota archaeon]|nr:LLM class F420-dependent oxidoreductase [Nitrososphaerota archaeon]
MKFGYILPNYGDKIGPRELVELALSCEEQGFDSVFATDHVIMPAELREPYGRLLEPLTTISFIASRTERLKVGTSILVLPQRNPVIVAKQAATIDAYSGGRLILGVGAGWAEKEFGFLNSDFRNRGKVLDESIRLMKALWSEESVEFKGRYFRISDAVFLPKPAKRDIPVWVGGNDGHAIRRAETLGDGWHPVGIGLEAFSKGTEAVRASGGTKTISIRMTTDVRKKRELVTLPSGERRMVASGSAADIRKVIGDYEKAGLDYFCASIMHPSAEETLKDIKRFGQDVVRSYS